MVDVLMTRNISCDIGTKMILFLKMISNYEKNTNHYRITRSIYCYGRYRILYEIMQFL